MSKTVPFAVIAAALLAASPALAAVNVMNKDAKNHTVVVNRGKGAAKSMNVAAGKSIQVDCPQNCGFRDLASGFSRIAGGNDKLVIGTHGMIHFKGGHSDMVFKK